MEKIFEEIYVENFSKLTEDILSICESRISAKFKQDYYKESKPYGYDNQIAKAYWKWKIKRKKEQKETLTSKSNYEWKLIFRESLQKWNISVKMSKERKVNY